MDSSVDRLEDLDVPEGLKNRNVKKEKKVSFKDKFWIIKDMFSSMKEKYDEKRENMRAVETAKGIKPLVTCRVLFISVLDKIFLVLLGLLFFAWTLYNFYGDVSSISYGFFGRVGFELIIVLATFILYLLYNWIYKCAVKTILCLTENEVYKEAYLPLFRWEHSIPLNKITKANSFTFLWIFRAVVIHQYGRLPLIFWTWNNEEFKEKLTELITGDYEKVQNKYDNKSIITKDKYKLVAFVGILFAIIILLLGVVRLFCYTFGEERKIVGNYTNSGKTVKLYNNGSCDITDFVSTSTKCSWSYEKETEYVVVNYEYSSYYYYADSKGSMTFSYDSAKRILEYGEKVYTFKK